MITAYLETDNLVLTREQYLSYKNNIKKLVFLAIRSLEKGVVSQPLKSKLTRIIQCTVANFRDINIPESVTQSNDWNWNQSFQERREYQVLVWNIEWLHTALREIQYLNSK